MVIVLVIILGGQSGIVILKLMGWWSANRFISASLFW